MKKLLYLSLIATIIFFQFKLTNFSKAENEVKAGDVVINEVMYYPASGDYKDEWIELYNKTSNPISIKDWVIYDNNTPKNLSDLTIQPSGFLIIKGLDLGGRIGNGLRNDGDFVGLKIHPEDQTDIDKVSWGDNSSAFSPSIKKVLKGHSIERYPAGQDTDSASDFIDQITPTPGQPAPAIDPTSAQQQPPLIDQITQLVPNEESADPEGETLVALSTIKDARQKPKNSEVLVEGIITTLPATLSNQYFYIQDQSAGIQIYSSKGNFPKLSSSQKIRVLGTTSESNNEKRIKISSSEDITILNQEKEPEPIALQTGQINENQEGMLVKVKGKVVEPSGNLFYLDDDSGKIKIYIKRETKIEKPEFKTDENVELAGIVSQYKDTYRILPRINSDIKTVSGIVLAESNKKLSNKDAAEQDEIEEADSFDQTPTKVLGASAAKSKQPFWPIVAILAGLGLIGYLIYDYQNQKRTGNSKIWSKVSQAAQRWRNNWANRRSG